MGFSPEHVTNNMINFTAVILLILYEHFHYLVLPGQVINLMNMNMKDMKVDIWSDIMCPFCYIGKRKYEDALSRFTHPDKIETRWHSYQLDPYIQPGSKQTQFEYIAARKKWPYEKTVAVHDQLVESAKEVGLDFRFDKVIVANTFDAHRLIHLANRYKLANAAEERLFKAFFTEGLDIGDHQVLAGLGKEIGLDDTMVRQMLKGKTLADEVHKDIEAARTRGLTGVPFFLFHDKYSISGAHPPEAFLDMLNKAYFEWEKAVSPGDSSGFSCTTDGECRKN